MNMMKNFTGEPKPMFTPENYQDNVQDYHADRLRHNRWFFLLAAAIGMAATLVDALDNTLDYQRVIILRLFGTILPVLTVYALTFKPQIWRKHWRSVCLSSILLSACGDAGISAISVPGSSTYLHYYDGFYAHSAFLILVVRGWEKAIDIAIVIMIIFYLVVGVYFESPVSSRVGVLYAAYVLVLYAVIVAMIAKIITRNEETMLDMQLQLREQSLKIEEQNYAILAQKKLVEEQNIEILKQKESLQEQNSAIIMQKMLLEEQTSEIEVNNTTLQETIKLLEETSRAKNDLLGMVAHDLKNPLAAIRLTAQYLSSPHAANETDRSEYYQDILDMSENMFRLVTDMLNTSAIEEGKVVASCVTFDVGPLTSSVVSSYEHPAAAKNIMLHAHTPSANVFADPSLVRQILDNLVSNALKYTPKGRSVYVTIESAEYHIAVRVRDEGPGISDEDQLKLFRKYQRLSARPTGDEHSSGLGLSIAMTFARLMNCTIKCNSTLGHGSMFSLLMPLAHAESDGQ